MKIRSKLLLNFGLLLLVMAFVFGVSTFSMYRERAVKTALSNALDLSQATESVRHQMMENRLALSNYLLTGAGTELDRLHEGNSRTYDLLREAQTKATDAGQRAGLNRIEAIEHEWYSTFADRFIQEHKDVDNGKINANDLLEQYTKAEPMEQLKRSNEVINEVQNTNRLELDRIRKSDETASNVTTWFSILGFFITLGLGILIAFRTAHSITEPLEHLITVARELGDKGDLSQQVDIEGVDEIGTLAQTFRNMVVYFKEMAAVSEAIAGGDLSVEVSPRSNRDTLASAFSQMTGGLRTLVRSVRDAAAQVAAGSNQVRQNQRAVLLRHR